MSSPGLLRRFWWTIQAWAYLHKVYYPGKISIRLSVEFRWRFSRKLVLEIHVRFLSRLPFKSTFLVHSPEHIWDLEYRYWTIQMCKVSDRNDRKMHPNYGFRDTLVSPANSSSRLLIIVLNCNKSTFCFVLDGHADTRAESLGLFFWNVKIYSETIPEHRVTFYWVIRAFWKSALKWKCS